MKKFIAFFAFMIIGTSLMAQSKYESTMTSLVNEIYSHNRELAMQPIANKLERVAAAEADEWLPNYWVAYCYIQDSFLKPSAAEKDQMLDIAEKHLEQANTKSPDNSEIHLLLAQYNGARLSVDGASRWGEYGPIYAKHMDIASKLDPTNPRVEYSKATNAYFTPEAFGGGAKIAKPFFEEALEKFETFEPKSPIHPNWGKVESEYFLSQIN
ncbi:hypothetical protein [Jiulongibacter sp. NS-SX5]|uniref:hypothetical protein n=1 Tax=Jiulongibacter sp. NS-SX5 TaxID=3463854 RepID=UPI004058602D